MVINVQVTAIGRTEILYRTIEALEDVGHDVERIVTCEAVDFENLAAELRADFLVLEDINAERIVAMFERNVSDIAVSVNLRPSNTACLNHKKPIIVNVGGPPHPTGRESKARRRWY